MPPRRLVLFVSSSTTAVAGFFVYPFLRRSSRLRHKRIPLVVHLLVHLPGLATPISEAALSRETSESNETPSIEVQQLNEERGSSATTSVGTWAAAFTDEWRPLSSSCHLFLLLPKPNTVGPTWTTTIRANTWTTTATGPGFGN